MTPTTAPTYTDIFQTVQADFRQTLAARWALSHCEHCRTPLSLETFALCGVDCGHRQTLEDSLTWLDQGQGRTLVADLDQIETARNRIDCHQCGACCRLASAPDDYATLQAKAVAGDSFAQEFLSVFLPYASTEDARARFPALVDQQTQYANNQPLHFYHCPYVTEDNRCGVYGTTRRPKLCEAYPETPLVFVGNPCAWKPWQAEQTPAMHAAFAKGQLLTHWHARITQALAVSC